MLKVYCIEAVKHSWSAAGFITGPISICYDNFGVFGGDAMYARGRLGAWCCMGMGTLDGCIINIVVHPSKNLSVFLSVSKAVIFFRQIMETQNGFFAIDFFLVPALLRDCSLCWDHFEGGTDAYTCLALPCGSRVIF